MTYAYRFHVMVERLPEEWESLSVGTRERLWQTSRRNLISRHEALVEHDGFPSLDGVSRRSDGNGWGGGRSLKEFGDAFGRFSSTFPSFTFRVHYFYWDLLELTVIRATGHRFHAIERRSLAIPGGRLCASVPSDPAWLFDGSDFETSPAR